MKGSRSPPYREEREERDSVRLRERNGQDSRELRYLKQRGTGVIIGLFL